MGWIYMTHDATDGAARFPDEPGVLEWQESRGWKRADEPEPEPFTPPKDAPASEGGWVALVHPDLPGVSHDWPDNPEALQGAHDAGWRYPELAEGDGPAESDPESGSKPAKKATAKRAAESATEQDKE